MYNSIESPANDNVKDKPQESIFSEVNTIPNFLSQRYIPSLDGFRAFSIVLVIISHIAFNFPNSVILKLELGGFGVTIFFVISGFLITLLLLKEKAQNSQISLKNFYIRRFLRILPVAYLFLLVLLILNRIFSLNLSGGDFIRPLLFVENFAPHDTFGPAKHYWSLSVEEQFYLIFPFILSRSLKTYVKTALTLIVIIPIITYVYYHTSHMNSMILNNSVFVLYNLSGHGILSILIGSITAILLVKYSSFFTFDVKFIELWQVLLLGISWAFYVHKMPLDFNQLFSAVLIAALIISSICNTNGIIFKILNFKPIRYIGILSYSLYIWQQIFTFQQPWANSFPAGKSILLNLFLLMATAMISYHLYEKSFLKLKRTFSRIS